MEDWEEGSACEAEGWEAEAEAVAECGVALEDAESAYGRGGREEVDEALFCALEGGDSADLLAAELETDRCWLVGWLLLGGL